MAESLRDQLLKAGLVNSAKVKKVEREKARQASRKGKKKAGKPGTAAAESESAQKLKQEAQRLRAEQAERDRELNARREAKARAKAVRTEIFQLIEQHKQDRANGEVLYHFVEDKKVKQVYVTPALRDGLAAGRMAVVAYKDRHEVLPREVADRILKRNERWSVHIAEQQSVDEDDPYAKYQIPDDLDW